MFSVLRTELLAHPVPPSVCPMVRLESRLAPWDPLISWIQYQELIITCKRQPLSPYSWMLFVMRFHSSPQDHPASSRRTGSFARLPDTWRRAAGFRRSSHCGHRIRDPGRTAGRNSGSAAPRQSGASGRPRPVRRRGYSSTWCLSLLTLCHIEAQPVPELEPLFMAQCHQGIYAGSAAGRQVGGNHSFTRAFPGSIPWIDPCQPDITGRNCSSNFLFFHSRIGQ
jgi:hypothetical protein